MKTMCRHPGYHRNGFDNVYILIHEYTYIYYKYYIFIYVYIYICL